MNDQLLSAIAQMFNSNMGNRITQELANGFMYGLSEVGKQIEAQQAPPPAPPAAPQP
ncbi:MAG: hypothetical protein WCJ66_04490 [Verrucomicrobiota bacterium]